MLHVIPDMATSSGGPPAVVANLILHDTNTSYTGEVLTAGSSGEPHSTISLGQQSVLSSQFAVLRPDGQRAVEDAVRGADILHLHTLWSPLVAVAAHTARRLRVPYVLSPHGMLDPWSMAQKSLKKRLYWQLIEGRLLRGAQSLVFTSQAERDRARLRLRTDGTVIPLGAEPGPASRPDLARGFFTRHPDLADRPILIFLGRLHPKKRPEAILSALPRILAVAPRTVLIYVGDGDADTRARLNGAALPFGPSVRFLGLLTGVEKWQALAAADLFILPSQQENFAIAAAEALRIGTPALLTPQVDIAPEVIAAGAGLMLNGPDLPRAIAESSVVLLMDRSRHTAMSASAIRLAESAYTWPECARRTRALYDRILAK